MNDTSHPFHGQSFVNSPKYDLGAAPSAGALGLCERLQSGPVSEPRTT